LCREGWKIPCSVTLCRKKPLVAKAEELLPKKLNHPTDNLNTVSLVTKNVQYMKGLE